jgi:NodT family efflux transporter outer membrane factor (OMF) lipoprotein
VLLGEHPGALHEELQPRAPIPVADPDALVGVPADIIRRRPDVRRAERQLASQVAQIGVAKADLYPTFSISGFIEGVAGTTSDLFTGDAVGWSIVPGFRWDLFQGGKIRNNVRVQEARTQQLLIGYQQSVLLALEEVESSLVAYERETERRAKLREAVDASERAVSLVRTQYLSGLTNFQNLLDTQRSLFQQQDLLAQSEGQVVLNLVFLNRALGGGWSLADPVPAEIVAEATAEEAPGGTE